MHLDGSALLQAIADDKDVDGLKATAERRRPPPHAYSSATPCIAAACEEVLRSLDVLRSSPYPAGGDLALSAPPRVLLLSVPPLLAAPLELTLEAAGCRISSLSDEDVARRKELASVRMELQNADVLLIGARRPEVVAAQWVKSGCVLLDLGLSTSAAPTRIHSQPVDLQNDGASDSSSSSGNGSPLPAVQRDVLCLCCSDGLSAMTAALRMRNASQAALLQQGFLEELEFKP